MSDCLLCLRLISSDRLKPMTTFTSYALRLSSIKDLNSIRDAVKSIFLFRVPPCLNCCLFYHHLSSSPTTRHSFPPYPLWIDKGVSDILLQNDCSRAKTLVRQAHLNESPANQMR